MLDFGGTAQKLWVLHCLDSFRPFLSVANLRLLSSFAVSRLAYLGFQSKEIVIDMLPHTGWYWSLSWLLCLSCIGNLYCATVCRFYKGVTWSKLAGKSLHWVISVELHKMIRWTDTYVAAMYSKVHSYKHRCWQEVHIFIRVSTGVNQLSNSQVLGEWTPKILLGA